ncbi:MAG: glycoside hydrolase family 43 protein [Oscillospiraceae bacterium]
MKKAARFFAVFSSIALALSVSASTLAYAEGELNLGDLAQKTKTKTLSAVPIDNDSISTNQYKSLTGNNPISSEIFCADPTSVEYNGRLYVFATNDHQQYEVKGADEDNTYEKIKSLVIYSTDDMVNWVYHGTIDVGKIAPWITNSWAPSVVSRVEADGLTHFYLYFSNNGMGVGVITATDPLGPWTDPLGKPFISTATPGLSGCPNPFDPGVVIDGNGDGWLSFGGGKAPKGSAARIVKLGDDMLSFDSAFKEIPAPYFFEASELNYINGTYVYTYNSDWSDHSAKWNYDCDAPTACSMVYMTTKTPLDPASWEMKGEYFKNPGLSGFEYSNNHTHLQKYKGNYYILYHTLELKAGMGIKGGYRSVGVDAINVDEEAVTIGDMGGTKAGVAPAANLNPYLSHLGAEVNNTADITPDTDDHNYPLAVSDLAGAWTSVKNVEFSQPVQEETTEPTQPAENVLTNVDTITYNLNVTAVDTDTTLTMYASDAAGNEVSGSVDVTTTGDYTITCDFADVQGLQNLGYFRASNGALVTFTLESIVINGQYTLDVSSQLTNTTQWADGLKNIWNGFADGDTIYSSDAALFTYVQADNAIKFYVIPADSGSGDESTTDSIENPIYFLAQVKGTGTIEVRLDSPQGDVLTSIGFDSADAFTTVYSDLISDIGGVHDLYFVSSDAGISMKLWQFSEELNREPDTSDTDSTTDSGENTSNGGDTSATDNTAQTGLGDHLFLKLSLGVLVAGIVFSARAVRLRKSGK